MGLFNRAAGLFGEYLFPSGCCLCGEMLTEREEILNGLCGDCSRSIQIEEGERCTFCGRPLISESGICLNCREGTSGSEGRSGNRPTYDQMMGLFPYAGRHRKLLWAFKYEKSAGAARFLADRLLEAVGKLALDDPVLIPVPPRPGKIRQTGWDQIDFLSRILRHGGKYPVSRCLLRLAHDTQKKLTRKERIVNLAGKIRFSPGIGKTKSPPVCVLFDDVITTGSTMNACAAALKSAGALKVYGVCLVYD